MRERERERQAAGAATQCCGVEHIGLLLLQVSLVREPCDTILLRHIFSNNKKVNVIIQ